MFSQEITLLLTLSGPLCSSWRESVTPFLLLIDLARISAALLSLAIYRDEPDGWGLGIPDKLGK